eukprot:2798121-Rhodomonas_salina.1
MFNRVWGTELFDCLSKIASEKRASAENVQNRFSEASELGPLQCSWPQTPCVQLPPDTVELTY